MQRNSSDSALHVAYRTPQVREPLPDIEIVF